ncbi:MAG: hypothetical protein QOC94_2259 [Actinoplanes sp.]|jgi:hypothetical protein|nr:hypothetical protein [Actinoplanes sp.]
MDDASAGVPARFRPTWQQAVGHGLYLGVLVAVAGVFGGLFTVLIACALLNADFPPDWLWPVLIVAPPLLGAAASVPLSRRFGIEIDARGIRAVSPFARGMAPWNRVVDLRAERRGQRLVVSVYLDSGASVQLGAPYSGGLFAADPKFEGKMFALSHLWRSHRFGGVPS